MTTDALSALRAQLREALRGEDPLELARVAGLLHRIAPDDPSLDDALNVLTQAPLPLGDAAIAALARVEEADEDDDPEQTWGALCALDEVLAAATLLGAAEACRPLTEEAVRHIRAFPEPWRPHADAATALLRDEPPPQGDPAWALWAAVEGSRWELPLDDAGMPARTRFELGFWVSLGVWGSENRRQLAAAEPLRPAPPWEPLAQGPGWEIALTHDDTDNPVLLCSDPAATARRDGAEVTPTVTPVGASFLAKDGDWIITHSGGTTRLRLDP